MGAGTDGSLVCAAAAMITLAACGAAPEPDRSEPAALSGAGVAALMTGRFDNAAQSDADARTRLHVIHEAAASETLGGALIYAQLHTGGPDGPVYRQRIYQFADEPGADGRLPMAVWTLRDPAGFADAARRAERLAALTQDDLQRFDPGCDFYWTGGGELLRGEITKGDCLIQSRSTGRELVVTAEFTISADLFTHGEAGRYQDDGEYAFAPEGGMPNHYDRVTGQGRD
ncbi:MAG: chromophore lyase CpcT/CpeT [Oceanicaulis sp.]